MTTVGLLLGLMASLLGDGLGMQGDSWYGAGAIASLLLWGTHRWLACRTGPALLAHYRRALDGWSWGLSILVLLGLTTEASLIYGSVGNSSAALLLTPLLQLLALGLRQWGDGVIARVYLMAWTLNSG
ncbi:hypothetical protein XM38_038220 [Halomicronema hongdechloris C2206]|uniref:Uncharacterized protein n=1 Tax=Halomicronema hongdechloris C2206 TaxID=1641165 RepID=A0A1Z3HRJ0_9CYAN|nr:hypothetical protein [Halomicronema hongdechloris]ASC72862.1 hypothetical protein XM38_038220 [Halomicronema hongdechloris C2206]